MIVFSSILALAAVPLGGPWTAAELVVAIVAIFELSLDVAPGLVFLAFGAGCDFVSRGFIAATRSGRALAIAGALFATGWLFQLVGHSVYEKNRPAFGRNLVHLLIGPAWIARKLFLT